MASTAVTSIALTAPVRTFERLAAGAIKPGHIVELTSSNTLQVAGTAQLKVAPLIALEKEYNGGDVSDAYAASDQVIAGVFKPGDEVALRVAAGAAAIAIGDRLQTAADGTVLKLSTIADLTHSVGTADGTVDDVTASFNQTTLNNNFKEITTKLNAILPGAGLAFAIALEAVDNSGGSSEAFVRAILA